MSVPRMSVHPMSVHVQGVGSVLRRAGTRHVPLVRRRPTGGGLGKFEAAVHRWQRRLELMDWQIDIIADIEKAHDGEIGEHAPHVTLDALPAYKRVSLFYAP